MHALFIKITTKLAGAHFYPACMAGAKLACCMHASLTGHCRSCIMHASLTVTGKLQEKATSRWPGGPHIRVRHAGREQKGPGHLEVARWTPHSSEGKPSQLSQLKPAFRPHQATSRWRGAMDYA
ncbi:hypothetical protein V6N13_074585 [Hibiscus sabdariffa]